ncbi:MAG TPA: hypothetical protein VF676_12740 [Flavobacterium sp.]|jgi:hypothetical protein
MEKLIREVFEIIKDYRADEQMMNEGTIERWIQQFNLEDREFILEEMKVILGKHYISQEKAKELMKEMIRFLAKTFEIADPRDFLLASKFIDNQPNGKSQKALLSFVDDIIKAEYGLSIAECNPEKPMYYLYIDDILCTGDTLVKNLTKNDEHTKGWFYQVNEEGTTNLSLFKNNGSKLILSYFAIHKLNIKKALSRIYYGLGKYNPHTIYAWDKDYAIENDIDNIDSKLNFLFPKESVKDDIVIECQNQIEGKIKGAGYHENDVIRYRDVNRPQAEEFFSSAENRERFEKIILDKCIQIYNSSSHLKEDLRPKPLGYGLYSDLSLGFGTLIFTWRNVPFNVPLVFWYRSQHWTPLFERKFVNYEN